MKRKVQLHFQEYPKNPSKLPEKLEHWFHSKNKTEFVYRYDPPIFLGTFYEQRVLEEERGCGEVKKSFHKEKGLRLPLGVQDFEHSMREDLFLHARGLH